MQEYLAALASSKLSLWVGKGKSAKPLDQESVDAALVEILDEKHRDRGGESPVGPGD